MDKYKLDYEMRRRHITTEQLCQATGMSRSAFYRKRNGISEFTVGEVNAICDFVGCSPEIFFTEKVS